jgi:hypothetical protein
MTYSPYGDRDSGGTRTDVDNEVHDDHDQEDRAFDGVDGHDANGHDANGHDANGAPFQRASEEDASVGGAVVDQDGNVVEGADPDVDGADPDVDVDGRDQPESVVAESSDGPDAVYTEHGDAPDGGAPDADAPDAEANVGDPGATDASAAAADTNAAATDTEAGTSEDATGHVRTDEATAIDVDEPEHAQGNAERDSATEDAMAGEDRAVEDGVAGVPADVADEHNEADAMTDADGEREYADGEPVGTACGNEVDAGPDGTPAMAPAADADQTAAGTGVGTYADDRQPDDAYTAGTYAAGTYADDTDAGRVAAANGALDNDMADSASDGDAPIAGAVDADYVAVGVAEPLSESEAADIADADGFQATPDADNGAVPLDAATAPDEAADATAVGMMPGDATVIDATEQPMPDADATHDRWQQIQLGFIDDPRGSVESARSLVVEAVEARISALRDRQTALDGWQNEATPDTEVLRAAIKGYRDLLNSLTDTQ